MERRVGAAAWLRMRWRGPDQAAMQPGSEAIKHDHLHGHLEPPTTSHPKAASPIASWSSASDARSPSGEYLVRGQWSVNRRSVEGLWKVGGRPVEGRWKIGGRPVEGRWRVGGRSVEGRREIGGKPEEDRWKPIGRPWKARRAERRVLIEQGPELAASGRSRVGRAVCGEVPRREGRRREGRRRERRGHVGVGVRRRERHHQVRRRERHDRLRRRRERHLHVLLHLHLHQLLLMVHLMLLLLLLLLRGRHLLRRACHRADGRRWRQAHAARRVGRRREGDGER